MECHDGQNSSVKYLIFICYQIGAVEYPILQQFGGMQKWEIEKLMEI